MFLTPTQAVVHVPLKMNVGLIIWFWCAVNRDVNQHMVMKHLAEIQIYFNSSIELRNPLGM